MGEIPTTTTAAIGFVVVSCFTALLGYLRWRASHNDPIKRYARLSDEQADWSKALVKEAERYRVLLAQADEDKRRYRAERDEARNGEAILVAELKECHADYQELVESGAQLEREYAAALAELTRLRAGGGMT